MKELSLNILDIAENSIRARATKVKIFVCLKGSYLSVTVEDNGCGMNEEELKKVTDPFFTTRTTRKVGLGVSFFKEQAEVAGGSFNIKSKIGEGTVVTAVFDTSHIDCLPLGNIAETFFTLVAGGENVDFEFLYSVDGREFRFDSLELKKELGGVSLYDPEMLSALKEFFYSNIKYCDGGRTL